MKCKECGHSMNKHKAWFHYQKGYHTRCEVGGVDADDIGWHCPCVTPGTKKAYKKRYPNY